MTAIATQVVNELIARLEEITIANGYATELPGDVQPCTSMNTRPCPAWVFVT